LTEEQKIETLSAAMIFFFADNHYEARPGAAIYESVASKFDIAFFEDDLSALTSESFKEKCDLLILNLIAGTGKGEMAGCEMEQAVRSYLEKGGSMLLLHGASAAFWHWDWWRTLVGFRWVRGNDPDGVEASWHPVRPYKVEVSKSRSPLTKQLKAMDLPQDEIYIHLEQVCPALTLMETRTDEGTFPQCWENKTPWGGRVIGFLPGHRKEVAGGDAVAENVTVLIQDLLATSSRSNAV
jgi:type 1 glutamine amidotransferase